jgi:DNA-binding CsgD family transcriptional regulator/PAS domain-containing protein
MAANASACLTTHLQETGVAVTDNPHLVEFYVNDEALVEAVSGFVAPALRGADAAIVVSTADHREAIDAALRAAEIDLGAAIAADRYLTFEAGELLASVMAGGAPDAARFGEAIGGLIERAAADGRRVRVFSEMAALLWRAGDVASAITIEDLSNDLSAVHEFALLCAYPKQFFEDSASADAFARICAQHRIQIPDADHTALDEGGETTVSLSAAARWTGGAPTDNSVSQALSDPLGLMDHAEQIGGSGSWEWNVQTGEMQWSDNVFRLLGLRPGSVVPWMKLMLEVMHPADVDRVSAAIATWPGDGVTRMLDYRIVRPDGSLRHLRSTVESETSQGARTWLMGSVQDVTSEHRIARKLAAHAAVSKALFEWEDFTEGVGGLLSGLGDALELCLGVLWLPQKETLSARLIWHEQSPSMRALAEAAAGWHPGRGSPVVGLAWQSRHPVICNQPELSAPPQLAAAISDAGIKAAIAIPAVAGRETLAVLQFFSYELLDPTEGMLRALNGIGQEIGRFLDARRGELSKPLLTRRGVEVLQMAADAMSASDIAREMHVSAATVKRHFEDSYARLGVGDRASAVAKAMRLGLIS